MNKKSNKMMTAPPTPVDDGKYIVFKRNEFYEMMGLLGLPPYYGTTESGHNEIAGKTWDSAPIAEKIQVMAESVALPDAVVIRRQDVFAAPALEAYANAILCAMALAKGSSLEGASIAGLQDIADYFHEQAEKSYGEMRKVPG